MAQVRYANQSGTVYVYDSVSEWDPVKKQSRSKRKCIGKVDPQTGEIIPTSGRRGRKPDAGRKEENGTAGKGSGPIPELVVLEKKYAGLEADYQKLKDENAGLSRENRKMKALLARFRKDVSSILDE